MCLEDQRYADMVMKAIRKHLKDDPRYLSIHIQSETGVPCWQASLRWGDAQEKQGCSRLIFAPDEQCPEAIIAKISLELSASRPVFRPPKSHSTSVNEIESNHFVRPGPDLNLDDANTIKTALENRYLTRPTLNLLSSFFRYPLVRGFS